ncbi:MAG TPA: hypothetical protein VFY99_03715 [Solirubrobacterales bacterium]
MVAVLLVALAVPAFAAAQGGYDTDPTREQFVAQADPKCKRANAKSNREFQPVEKLVKKGKYKAAGERLIRGEEYQLELYRKLGKLDRPPADAKTIGKWLRTLKEGSQTWIGAGKDLKKKKFKAAGAGLEDAEALFKKARKKVKGFGFRYCA